MLPLTTQGGQDRRQTILALDFGRSCGWALSGADGQIKSGTWRFTGRESYRYLRFRQELIGLGREVTVDLALFEATEFTGRSWRASHEYGGYRALLLAWCETHGTRYRGVPVGTIKRFATGDGSAKKDAMIEAVRSRGFNPRDDHEADALALLLLGLEPGNS